MKSHAVQKYHKSLKLPGFFYHYLRHYSIKEVTAAKNLPSPPQFVFFLNGCQCLKGFSILNSRYPCCLPGPWCHSSAELSTFHPVLWPLGQTLSTASPWLDCRQEERDPSVLVTGWSVFPFYPYAAISSTNIKYSGLYILMCFIKCVILWGIIS